MGQRATLGIIASAEAALWPDTRTTTSSNHANYGPGDVVTVPVAIGSSLPPESLSELLAGRSLEDPLMALLVRQHADMESMLREHKSELYHKLAPAQQTMVRCSGRARTVGVGCWAQVCLSGHVWHY